MEKKIIAIMVSLLIVAALVVASVLIAAGGIQRAGGFTSLFDKLENPDPAAEDIELRMPSGWSVGDKKTVSDTIVDMSYYRQTVGQTSVYITTLWFVYLGDKWNDPLSGTYFSVPDSSGDGWMYIDHGMFYLRVSSATNLSASYDIGDVITVETMLVMNNNAMTAFGDWVVADTI